MDATLVAAENTTDTNAASSRWAVRIFVLAAFALTLWLCGPRAAAVLAARLQLGPHDGPTVDLDRVGFLARPEWLDRELLLAVSTSLSPQLQGDIAMLDDAAGRRLRDELTAVPWVREVRLDRVMPDRLQMQLELRRPVLAVRDADGDAICLVDGEAIVLPWVDTPLPVTLLHREGGPTTMAHEPGRPAMDARVRTAAAIAVEWRDAVAPLVPDCPALVEVDATNLGERWLRGPSYPEVRVKLRRADGGTVIFAYGRPVDSALPRVLPQTKAGVLANILARYPGLQGLVAGDLRLARRWADYLQPRERDLRDPHGPWSELQPRGG
ncbi:MAG: hypothetical protein JNM25_02430 [Planctomycetes bacterium]|nr:hypothetical protein [Planctomycetota bacterium]